jgi:hypothetical protein
MKLISAVFFLGSFLWTTFACNNLRAKRSTPIQDIMEAAAEEAFWTNRKLVSMSISHGSFTEDGIYKIECKLLCACGWLILVYFS